MRSTQPSRADRELLDELERRRCTVSDTQLERWRYWRRSGLIPRTIKHGEGRGSRSEYPNLNEAADRACEVRNLLRRYDSLDEVAIVLATRGRRLGPESVKAALLDVLGKIEERFRSHQPRSDDPFETAVTASRALMRAWSEDPRLRAQAPPLPKPALEVAGFLLIGHPVASHQLRQLLEETSLAKLASNLGFDPDPFISWIEERAGWLSFTGTKTAVAKTDASGVIAALGASGGLVDSLPIPEQLFPTQTAKDVTAVGIAIGLLTMEAYGAAEAA
jgi:hypothetical protein